MNILIGIDLGTTKLAAVALDADSGELLAVHDCPNSFSLPASEGVSEQDAAAICAAAFGLTRELVADPLLQNGEIIGVGVTGQMHGVTIVDAYGSPLTPLINWQDCRGQLPDDESGASYTEHLCQLLGEERLNDCGGRPASGYGAVTLFRLARLGLLPETGTVLTIHDLLVFLICGKMATDPTDAASWGIYDVRGGSGWLPGVAEVLGIPVDVLPPILPTGSCADTVSPTAAAASGLPAGIPVAVALGDNQASFIASVPSLTDSLLLNLGTGGQMSIASPNYLSHELLDTRPLIPGYWLLVGASLCGGRAYQLLARFFEQAGAELFGQTLNETTLYSRMNGLAYSATPITMPTVIPYFCGTRTDPEASALIGGLTTSNFTPANLIRATIIGMLQELLSAYDIARGAGATARVVVGAGNALRRNPLMQYELTVRSGLPLIMPPLREEAAVGAALAAGVASGNIASCQEASKLIFPEHKDNII